MRRLIARNTSLDTVIADKVGVAATRATRAVGLLTRSGLEPGEALWIVPSRGVHTWGMRFAIDVARARPSGHGDRLRVEPAAVADAPAARRHGRRARTAGRHARRPRTPASATRIVLELAAQGGAL